MSVVLRLIPCALLVATGLFDPVAAQGALTVTRSDDPPPDGCAPGDCSLREAIVDANAAAGMDTIQLAAGTYTLAIPPDGSPDDGLDGDLDLFGEVTISGAGAGTTVIDGASLDRIVHVIPTSTVEISDVTLRNGSVSSAFGGGVANISAQLTLVRVWIANNRATNGSGGGIINNNPSGNLTIVDSVITGNDATVPPTGGNGGGLLNINGATATLTNVTISGNTANQVGGGIANQGGPSTTTLLNSTVTGNTADPDLSNPGATAGGGIYSGGSNPVVLTNTILAGNHDPDPTLSTDPDCSGPLTSNGHNLIGSVSPLCTHTPGPGDLTGVDPILGPLADNGGPTMTHALLSGSSAVDGGAGCPPADQRGAPRAGACDIGAYELVLCGDVVVNRVGTEGDDSVAGTGGPDGVLALGGNDVASTGAGNDAVCAGDGADTVLGEGGRDVLRGGSGNDRLSGGAQKDRLFGESGKDRLNGGSGKDRCRGGPGKDRNRKCEKGKP